MLLITEKKDQAKKLAAAINLTEGSGFWKGKLNGDDITVVCASGHLLEMLTPSEVNPSLTWDDPKMLTPVPRDYRIKVIEGGHASRYLSNIAFHLKNKDTVIVGTDADREGELIFWRIIKHLGWKGEIKRAWFAAGLDKKSMTAAVNDLREPSVTYGYAVAAESRGRSDWPYMHLTRAYSFYARHNCFGPHLGRGNGKSSTMSVGRVQTPTLGMVVKREHEIKSFVPKKHYKIKGSFTPSGEENQIIASYFPVVTNEVISRSPNGVSWEPSKALVKEGSPAPLDIPLFTDKAEVDLFTKRLKASANLATVLSYSETQSKESPPKTFSLPGAVSKISKDLKVSTGLAQTILEDLYEQGWTSYARTSKSELPYALYDDVARNEMFDSLVFLPEVNKQASFARSIHNDTNEQYPKFVPPIYKKKDMEHYGIVPTSEVMTEAAFNSLTPKKMDGKSIKHTKKIMQDAYLIIAKQFVRAMYPAAVYANQNIQFEMPVVDLLGNPSSIFKVKSSRMVNPGWRAAFGETSEKDSSVTPLKQGSPADLTSVDIKGLVTSPPSRYTEENIQESMANIGKTVSDHALRALLNNSEGIGTPATRKQVIQTLLDREYIVLVKGYYQPTNKGIGVIKSVPRWLSNPETTALWEDYLVKIQNEKDPVKAHGMRDVFVSKQVKLVDDLIDHLNNTLFDTKGEPVEREPAKVSPKMKTLIKRIASSKNVEIPNGTLKDMKKAQEFLGKYLTKTPNDDSEPSEDQKNKLNSIIPHLPDPSNVPPEVWVTSSAAYEFISKNKKLIPPSPGQISFAEKLIKKLPEGKKPPSNVLKSAEACSKFIDAQTKGWGKKKGSGTAKK
ncbi:DNA topoisomerase [Psychromonas sp. SP041]|uniref:DNA topoisomerase n=1 Tax=Psychromonas sp. SP041 TaxID=1365007 RepID=UPI001F0E37D7|nr:DNA topoisomerase [Psychromonas sp. SP041]